MAYPKNQFELTKTILSVEPSSVGLTSTEKCVLLHLSVHFNIHSGGLLTCWPSQTKIASLCGVSRKTVNQALNKCESVGCIKTTNRKKTSKEYTWIGFCVDRNEEVVHNSVIDWTDEDEPPF